MASIQKEIEKKIMESDGNTILSITDFGMYGKYDTVKRSLQRCENTGKLIRIIDGIYYIPKYSKLTGDLIPPSINDVAHHIALKYDWSIVPTGDACLNALGLSTQMPVQYEYVSDGPYRKYSILNATISFKHTSNKEIKSMSYKSALVVQALKSIGKENVNEKDLKKIRTMLTDKEQDDLLNECRRVTSWIYEDIKKIAEERYD